MYNLIISKKPTLIAILVVWALSSCTTSFYVVRHAEKSATPKEDPLLTVEGSQRAERLKTILENKGIEKIYSTKTVRTMTTGKPMADAISIQIEIYEPKSQTAFLETLKKSKQNTLIIGHSNTIRHIINGLAEKEFLNKDLEDSEYSNLFLVKRVKLGKPKVKVQQF